jgi:eukaryotic-like serine/threonine-protein kinase
MSDNPEQRYDLQQQLWHDGPHAGWLAYDRILGREVVFNFPYRPRDEQSFLQKAKLRARFRHANLVPLYDLGIMKNGKPFFTEPYLKATELSGLQRDCEDKAGDVTLARLVNYLLDACQAIAFIHASGFLHLQIRPSAVLLLPESQEVFVVRGHPSEPPFSFKTVGVDGSIFVPPYMAPEQADPQTLGGPDVRTDVYGLGGLLYEILYDQPPNADSSVSSERGEIIKALLARKGPPPRRMLGRRATRCPDLARKLESVCLAALESERNARAASVSAFMNALEQCVWGTAA